MNIKIDNINNKEEYINEAMYISRFKNKIIKDKNKKISSYTTNIIVRTIFIAIITLFTIYFCIINGNNIEKDLITFIINLCVAIFTSTCLLIMIITLIRVKKTIKLQSRNKTNSELIIEKDKIVLINNNTHITVTYNLDDIVLIKISKYCITFFNKDIINPPIIIPIEIKDDLIKALNKYNITKEIIGE